MDMSSGAMLAVLAVCDETCEELYFYNPNHQLVSLRGKDLPSDQYNERNLRVIQQFLSRPQESRVVSAEQFMIAFKLFQIHLSLAVIVEKLKLPSGSLH